MRLITTFVVAAALFGAGPAFANGLDALKSTPQSNQVIRLAQSSCGSGLSVCAPGSYGPGGCYKLGYANCTAGLVCTGGMQACKPSNGGAAYCYKQGYGKCK